MWQRPKCTRRFFVERKTPEQVSPSADPSTISKKCKVSWSLLHLCSHPHCKEFLPHVRPESPSFSIKPCPGGSGHCNAWTIRASAHILAGRGECANLSSGWMWGAAGHPQHLACVQGLCRCPCCRLGAERQQRACWTSKTRKKHWLMEPYEHWCEQLVNHYHLEVSRKIRTNIKQRWNKQLLYGQKWIFSFHSK